MQGQGIDLTVSVCGMDRTDTPHVRTRGERLPKPGKSWYHDPERKQRAFEQKELAERGLEVGAKKLQLFDVCCVLGNGALGMCHVNKQDWDQQEPANHQFLLMSCETLPAMKGQRLQWPQRTNAGKKAKSPLYSPFIPSLFQS